jgi:uncharacterized membrane protein
MSPSRAHNEVERETGHGVDLWRVIAAPIIWALHFLFCYVFVAIYCEKFGRASDLTTAKYWIVAATLIALAGIAWLTMGIWRVRARSVTDNDFEFEHNSPEERHRFLSHAALMLSVLSAIAVLYVVIPALYLSTCR